MLHEWRVNILESVARIYATLIQCLVRFTLCLKKVSHLMFVNNVGKCERTFKIFHRLIHKKIKSVCIHRKDFHLTCNMLLHYLVKTWHVPADSVNTWFNI